MMRSSTPSSRCLPGIFLGLLAACGGTTPPATAPTPVTAHDTALPPAPVQAPPLPAIPRVEGPLAIKVVYPSANQQLTSRGSNFSLGSVGGGRASLFIDGVNARVYPNGAFMAF